MNYATQLLDLMVQVMLPLGLLVTAGALWPRFFRDTDVEQMKTALNRLVMYLLFPCILFAVSSTTPITLDLLSVPLLVGTGSLTVGGILYLMLYRMRLWPHLNDGTRASLVLAGMFGNTFNIGVPVLVFFFGAAATSYAAFNDMLMTMPLVWSLGVWISTRLGGRDQTAAQPSVFRVMMSMPPIWAFLLGTASQQFGLTYEPLVNAARFIGQANIPVILFVLGMTIPWRNLKPRPEILAAAGIKLLATPLIVWLVAPQLFDHVGEAQHAAVALAATPSMMTAMLLANRFRLDDSAAALLIGWSTILFWITLPLIMAFGWIGAR
ncbi:MAG: AEC family transporter [Betaproteobacteria bacterium]|nr:MAG: AEC family transporter [Betaproteobacteria bacterium]